MIRSSKARRRLRKELTVMKKHDRKTYEENEVKYSFNADEFRVQINLRKDHFRSKGNKITKEMIKQELADKCFVSTDAIKNWMYEYNSPSEIEQVKQIAEYFNIEYHKLLSKEDTIMTNKEMKNLDNGVLINKDQERVTKDKVRDIYVQMLNFIYSCDRAWTSLSEGIVLISDFMTEEYCGKTLIARKQMMDQFSLLSRTLDVAMLDIPRDLFDKVYTYIWKDFPDFIDMIALPDIEEIVNMTQEEFDKAHPELTEEIIDDPYIRMEEYLNGGYRDELRELFADYMLD